MFIKNKLARRNFINWFFSNPQHIEQLKEELIEDGISNWSFDSLLEIANNVPEYIQQELKYADRLDADAEAQDYNTFGKDKV
tara:strand:+ start:4703 stop:4948 length:246 start_codon:yes stop_codon:yes gene_type:complete